MFKHCKIIEKMYYFLFLTITIFSFAFPAYSQESNSNYIQYDVQKTKSIQSNMTLNSIEYFEAKQALEALLEPSDVKVDVVIAIDNTGSMGGAIAQAKANAKLIAEAIQTQIPNTRFGAIRFRDYSDSYVTQILTQPTESIDVFKSAVDMMSAGGGADTPEAYIEVVHQATDEISWRPDALNLLVIIGDAPPHDPIYGTDSSPLGTWADAASKASNNGIVVSMIATGGGISDTRVGNSYTYMANATGGIYSASSDASQLATALIELINTLSGELPLVVSTYPASFAENVPISTTTFSATFNIDLDPATVTLYSVYLDTGTMCLFTDVWYDEDSKTIMISPYDQLEKGKLYTVILTNSIRAADSGRAMGTYRWTFSTEGASPKELSQQAIDAFSKEANVTLESAKNFTAQLVYDGFQKINKTDQLALFRDLGDILLSYGTSGFPHLGHLKGMSKEIAGIAFELRKMTGTLKVGAQFFKYLKYIKMLETELNEASTVHSIQGTLEYRYPFYRNEPTSIDQAPDYIGTASVREHIEKLCDQSKKDLSDDLSLDQAAKIIKYFDLQKISLLRARYQELFADFRKDANVPDTRLIGTLHDWRTELEAAFRAKDTEETVKWSIFWAKVGTWGIKAAGVGLCATGVGAAVGAFAFAGGEYLLAAETAVGLGWDIGSFLASLQNMTPNAKIVRAYTECINSYGTEAFLIMDYVDNSCYRVKNIKSSTITTGMKVMESSIPVLLSEIANVSVLDFVVPPYVYADDVGEGSIRLQNSGVNTVRVFVSGYVVGPFAPGTGRMLCGIIQSNTPLDIKPSSEGELSFEFNSISTIPFGLFGSQLILFVEVMDLSDNSIQTIGPIAKVFHVGSSSQQTLVANILTEDVLENEIGPGENLEAQIQITGNPASILLTLTVAEAGDADLHLYSPLMEHVGLDITTGNSETKIPGSQYSGDKAKVEYILLNNPEPGIFRLRVSGRSGHVNFVVTKVEVPAMGAILTAIPEIMAQQIQAGKSEKISLMLRESAGSEDITALTLTIGELKNEFDVIFPTSSITLDSFSDAIPKGLAQVIAIKVDVPANQELGVYRGNLQIHSSAGKKNVEIALEVSPPDLPVANAGLDQNILAGLDDTANVFLDGSGSSDPEGGTLTYTWTLDGSVIATGVKPLVNLPVGVHTITLVVNDGQLDSAPDTVTITVKTPKYKLTVSSGENGTVNDASGYYNKHSVVILTAVPAEGYRVKKWYGISDHYGHSNTVQVLMDSGKSVRVEFEPIPAPVVPMVQLTYLIAGGQGVIPATSGEYEQGTTIPLTATPAENCRVKCWHDTDNDASTDSSNTVCMTSDKIVSVEFELIPVNLTFNIVGKGATTPITSGTRNQGSVETLTVSLQSGYRILSWSGTDNDSLTDTTNTVTMDSDKAVIVEVAKSVSANKVAMKLSSKLHKDTITATGEFDAELSEIQNASGITVRILDNAGELFSETLYYNSQNLKKENSFSYKNKVATGDPAAVSMLMFSLAKNKFGLSVNNLDLPDSISGSLFVILEVGSYTSVAEIGSEFLSIKGKN